MFGLNHLGNAIRTLSENVLALANTVRTIDTGIRGQLRLDGPDPVEVPAIGHTDSNGEPESGEPVAPSGKRKAKASA